MAQVKVGDRVRIADREPTNADIKSGLFYGYFANLVGKVERVYDDSSVCLDVEIDSLPEDVRVRHTEMQTAARDKWISGLPQEQRNRLSEQDKQFNMSYKVLVASTDVEIFKGGKSVAKAKPAKSETAAKPKAVAETTAVAPEEKPENEKQQTAKDKAEEAARRLTQKDLEAKEAEYLKALQSGQETSEKKPRKS